MSNLITNLPESWEAINPIGERINKRMLLHACWGHCKDDEAARILTQDILTAYPCEPTAPPIYGTLATAHMQTGQSTNSLRHPISAPHTVSDPLSAGLAIFQIYKPSGRNSGHFYTVTVSRHQLYLYDSLPHSVARDTTNLLVTTIKRFYANQSPDLASQLANRVTSMHTPRQVDQPTPWSCSMHMLCSSLAAIYQQTNPCLLYDQSHVDQMHRIHLRRLITGTLHPWLADFIPLLQNRVPPDQAPPPTNPSAGGNPLPPTHPSSAPLPHSGRALLKANLRHPAPRLKTTIKRPKTQNSKPPQQQSTLLQFFTPTPNRPRDEDIPPSPPTPPAVNPNTTEPPPPPRHIPPDPDAIPCDLTLLTLNTRGMHTTILDMAFLLKNNTFDIISLTETKHTHVTSTWRTLLSDYKLVHNPTKAHNDTNRHRGGTILAIKRRSFLSIEGLPVPELLHPHVVAAEAQTPTGPPLLIISAYMPQLHNSECTALYREAISWIIALANTHPSHHLYLGGDFQATPEPTHPSYSNLLSPLGQNNINPINPPTIPTFQPSKTPLDHWFHRGQIQPKPHSFAAPSANSDHSGLIVQIHKSARQLYALPGPQKSGPLPSTRRTAPFQLPLTEHQKTLYRNPPDTLRLQTQELAAIIAATNDLPTKHDIDRLAQSLLDLLNQYLEHAIIVWPQRPARDTLHKPTTKPFLTKPTLRQLSRLVKLRNYATLQTKHQSTLGALRTEAAKLLPETPHTARDIHTAAKQQISKLLRTAATSHRRRREDAENRRYDSNPKAYHKTLKVQAGLEPQSASLPRLQSVIDPHTGQETTDPATVVATVQEYFTKELKRATPEDLPRFPWENPDNPDNFSLTHPPTARTHPSLATALTQGHYNLAIRRLAEGKAPGPDGIPNEILKHLPTQVHDIIFHLFQKMAAISYTPQAWCMSATCLLFKPQKKDPTNPACYRPIALMNCILKLWTSTFTMLLTDLVESEGMVSDSSDGFRSDRQIHDSLATHIHVLEDAKINKRNIYIVYADFKGAFNATDHTLLFQFMRRIGIPDSYVNMCEQLYTASSTYFMTPHGNTTPLDIQRGTLQGDTLSPFLFTLFIEPLMRWLKVGSRGYQPECTLQEASPHHITYDQHGYADDISITTGSLHNMIIQLRKLQLFSDYTGLQLEIPKCEITGALWSQGNPMSKANLEQLRTQLSSINLSGKRDGPSLKFLPPNESYKMLGVHVNPLLDFRQHYLHVTSDVRRIASALRHRPLSPYRKQKVVDQLLKSKYHAIHLGILSKQHLLAVDRCINAATRKAQGLTPSHPTEGIYAKAEDFGLDRHSIAERIIQLGAAHLNKSMNRPTDRGLISYKHVHHITAKYMHWPTESLDHPSANLPTLRLLSHIYSLPGIEYLNIPRLWLTNPIADTIRAASQTTDKTRTDRKASLPEIQDDEAYKSHYKRCTPLRYHDRVIKHLTPLWEANVRDWKPLLYRRGEEIKLHPITHLTTKLLPAYNKDPTLRARLRVALRTLGALLSTDAHAERHTLPDSFPGEDSRPTVHDSWHQYLPTDLKPLPPGTLSEIAMNAGNIRQSQSKKRKATHHHDAYHIECPLHTEYDILEIHDDRLLSGQRQYLVSWCPEILSQEDIDAYESLGFQINTKTPYLPDDPSDQKYTVHWHPSWQLDTTVAGAPSGPSLIQAYKAKNKKKNRHTPPHNPPRPMGWHPRYFTSTTTPINPDLDAIGTGMATITAHPTEPNLVLLHAEDGRHLHTIPLRKLHQLHSLHSSDTPLALDIRDSYSRSKAFTKLRPAKTSLLTPPLSRPSRDPNHPLLAYTRRDLRCVPQLLHNNPNDLCRPLHHTHKPISLLLTLS